MTILLASLALPAALLALLERSPRLRVRPLPLLRPHAVTDVVYLLTGFVVGGAATALCAAAAAALLDALGVPRVAALALPAWLLVPAALVALDASQYAVHRAMHRSDVLWRFHAAHHSSLALDWLASFRSHAVEQVLRRVAGGGALVLLGVPPDAIGLTGAVFTAVAMLNHANLELRLGPLSRVLVSPAFHRLHHVPRTTESNFGTVLVVWDVLAGTAVRPASPTVVAACGLPGDRPPRYPQDWAGQLVAPFRRRGVGSRIGRRAA